MSEQIKAKATDAARSVAPWRKGVPWWLVLIEGILLLALGFLMYLAPVKSRILLAEIIAGALGIAGAIQLFATLRSQEKGPLATWNIVRGAIGLTVGIILVIMLLLNSNAYGFGRFILGIGAFTYGAIGIYIIYLTHETGLRLGAIINCIFFVLIGAVMLIDLSRASVFATMTNFLNIILLFVGAFLIIWAFALRNQKQDAPIV